VSKIIKESYQEPTVTVIGRYQAMLVAGIGAPALWIAVVTVGIALVIIGRVKPSAPGPR